LRPRRDLLGLLDAPGGASVGWMGGGCAGAEGAGAGECADAQAVRGHGGDLASAEAVGIPSLPSVAADLDQPGPQVVPRSRAGGSDHQIGWWTTGAPGPLAILTGGMHGNEPAGVAAIARVMAALRHGDVPVHGRVVGLAGNVCALARRVRFIDRDLNRGWEEERIESLRASGGVGLAEDREQLELLLAFEALASEADGDVYLLDLHTMSANGVPFIVACDSPPSRALAEALVLPGIAGLENSIPGTTLSYFLARGFRAVAVEGGQHDDPAAVDLLEAVTWLMLTAAGVVDRSLVPDLTGKRELLQGHARGEPRHVTVCYRHGVLADDGFEMLPGFRNLAPVQAGQPLARDRRGPIVAPRDGWIVLPLYQKAGNDGFFIGAAA